MSSNIFLPHPSLPVYVFFSSCSSISLTRRPIMQGQRPSGNPPLRLHATEPSASNICACVIAFRVKYVRVRTTHVGNRTLMYSPHGNWRANTLATAGFLPFSRQYLKYQRETSTHGGTYNRTDRQTDRKTDRSRFFISKD